MSLLKWIASPATQHSKIISIPARAKWDGLSRFHPCPSPSEFSHRKVKTRARMNSSPGSSGELKLSSAARSLLPFFNFRDIGPPSHRLRNHSTAAGAGQKSAQLFF